jgi:MinD superfamily P-loop ATPase
VIAAVRGSDFALLVTEPTPFGLHDLGLAVETVRQLGMPFGVIINRANAGDTCVTEFCRKENIAVLLEVPEDRRVAETISNGGTLLDAVPGMRAALRDVLAEVHLRCATTGAAQ